MLENSVADYKTEVEVCSDCEGLGERYFFERKNFIKYLASKNVSSLGIAMYHARKWKLTKTVTCLTCDGHGSWEVKY